MSGLFRREKNFTSLLGEVTYNETGEAEADTRLLLTSHCTLSLSGHIVGAAVTSITLLGLVNLTALREFGSAGSRGDVIDRCWCWEYSNISSLQLAGTPSTTRGR